ncbi:MAG: recombination mediator RecR [Actinobacteria bacterium]|jgi:recombination protein RecR|nr:recombination mediator RecR [Actinomycetota bacterium]MCL6105593.1 recombination mediator RecR [Actinomycetota bacterium]
MLTESFQNLVEELQRLPAIGPKSAQRIAFHLLGVSKENAMVLAKAIARMKERVAICPKCFSISEIGQSKPSGAESVSFETTATLETQPEAEAGKVQEWLCSLCADPNRDFSLLCVVEDVRDLVAIENTNEYKGLYHVLGGTLNPLDGIGPDRLRIKELVLRVDDTVSEVILCTNPTLDGEATAMYIAKLLAPANVKVTRIASGLPVGGELEYADELTLGRALEGRTVLSTS